MQHVRIRNDVVMRFLIPFLFLWNRNRRSRDASNYMKLLMVIFNARHFGHGRLFSSASLSWIFTSDVIYYHTKWHILIQCLLLMSSIIVPSSIFQYSVYFWCHLLSYQVAYSNTVFTSDVIYYNTKWHILIRCLLLMSSIIIPSGIF